MEMSKYTAIACKVIESEKAAREAFDAEQKRHDEECKKLADQLKAAITAELEGMDEETFLEWMDKARQDDNVSPHLYRIMLYTYGIMHPKFGRKVRRQEQFDAVMGVLTGAVLAAIEAEDDE